MKKSKLVLLSILLLAACNPQASDLPTLHIAISPAAQPVSETIANCAPINSEAGLSIEMRYPDTVELAEFDLLIRLGEPGQESVFAAQLAWEQIALVVNPGNDVDISRDIVAALFSGRVQSWPELGGDDVAVSLWAGPEGDEARQAFEADVLLGSVSGGTHVATNPATSIEAVANDPGGAAILPAAWADETVKLIDLDIQLPLIAVAADEPTGAVRELLACLQGPVGQAALSDHYIPFQQ